MKHLKKTRLFGAALSLLIMLFIIPGIAVSAIDDDLITEEVPAAVEETPADADDDARAGAGNTKDDVQIPATRIVITGNRKTLDIGQTVQVRYSLYPRKSDDYVVYRSALSSVATVSKDGLVTAVGAGQTYIVVTTGSGRSERMTIIVRSPEDDTNIKPTGVVLDDSFAKLRKGKTVKISARMFPIGAAGTFTYKSQNNSIATVDSGGTVTGINAGETVITVTSGKFTESFTVSVYSGRYKGIDVSRWNGDIDWSKVNDDGIDFAMIRSGYGFSYVDPTLKANVAGCENNGIAYGFYHYTYADTPAEARTEAAHFMKTIAGYNPDFPIVMDIEEQFYQKMSRNEVTAIIDAFASVVESYGYEMAVYSNAYFLTNHVNLSYIEARYPIWVASWGSEEKLNAWYDGDYMMWQYSADGTVSGIDGKVDLNYYYR